MTVRALVWARSTSDVSCLPRYTFDSRLSVGCTSYLIDVELEVVERAAHVVEAVLRLDHDFVEARGVGPRFGSPRSARGSGPGRASRGACRQSSCRGPCGPRSARSRCSRRDQVGELRLGFVGAELVHDLERDRHDAWTGSSGRRRLGHQDQELAVAQPLRRSRARSSCAETRRSTPRCTGFRGRRSRGGTA